MGSNHEKNGGRKSRDTLPLTVKSLFLDCYRVGRADFFTVPVLFRDDQNSTLKKVGSGQERSLDPKQ